ncbi:hypothetical protein JST97_03570 [bacterium]|nr:hypothetical protein [bacterium]
MIRTEVNSAPKQSPKLRTQAAPAQTSRLLHCALQLGKDCFTPGYAGERARMRSLYQLSKQLGTHQAMDAQAQPQDLVSRSSRLVRSTNRCLEQSLETAGHYWREEARTAKGLYRGVVGLGQGATSVGEVAFRSTKSLAKLSLKAADMGFRTLNGERSLTALLGQTRQAAEILCERGSRYLTSGQFVNDAKKFSKSLSDYGARVQADPMLEVPKATFVVAAAVVAAAPRRVAATAEGLAGLGESVAAAGESSAVMSESMAAAAGESSAALGETSQLGGASLQIGTPGGIVPKGYVANPGAAACAPPPAAPLNQELLRNFQQALKLSQRPGLAETPGLPAPAAVPAPLQLPPRVGPLPTHTPVCLPSSNYAPAATKGFLQLRELPQGCLDITG